MTWAGLAHLDLPQGCVPSTPLVSGVHMVAPRTLHSSFIYIKMKLKHLHM